MLGAALRSGEARKRNRAVGALAAVLGITAADLLASIDLTRTGASGEYAVRVAKAITIGRPPEEIYRFWRDFANLPRFMENVHAVETFGDGRSEWTIAAPAGTSVTLSTAVTEDREGELISWRSLPGSEIEAEGRVAFRDAPGGRGSIVEATVAYRPPGGELGRWVAKLFGREPEIQGRRELRRFKMLMETGEIATARNGGENHED
jgi:uncharacterized membrane protein